MTVGTHTQLAQDDDADATALGPAAVLRPLLGRWSRHPVTPEVRSASQSGASFVVAVAAPIRPAWLAALPDLVGRPVVAVLPSAADVDRTAVDVASFREEVRVVPAWETLPYEHVSPGIDTMGRRLAAFHSLAADEPPALTLLGIRALLQRVVTGVDDIPVIDLHVGERTDLEDLERRLSAMGYERSYLVEARGEFAVRGGILDVFPSCDLQPVRIELWGDEVETIRRFSVADQRSVNPLDRIGILPAREILPGEEVRRRATEASRTYTHTAEPLGRIAAGEFFAGMESWLPWLLDDGEGSLLDLLPERALLVVCEPRRCLDRAADLRREEEDLAEALARTWQLPHAGVLEAIADADDDTARAPTSPGSGALDRRVHQSESAARDPEPAAAGAADGVAPTGSAGGAGDLPAPPRLFLDAEHMLADYPGLVWQVPSAAEGPDMPAVTAGVLEPSFGRPDALVASLRQLSARGLTVVVAADGKGSRSRIRAMLASEGFALDVQEGPLRSDPRAGCAVTAPLSRGFISTELSLAVVAEADITGRWRTHRRPAPVRRRGGAEPQTTYGDLRPSDYVVHYRHGVGRFEGIVSRDMSGVEREYLDISYAGHDKLYVPVDQAETVRKYLGGETPRLSRMGGSDWARTKGRVGRAVAEIAEELVKLYRNRAAARGHAFAPDGDLARTVAETFPYEETPDQQAAIDAVRSDMEAPVPMDRLVCGDVGYGKTEIAVRAALKSVGDGRQAAVLVPTTVLAQQHFQTFGERYADLPVRVEMLSRFLTPRQQRGVLDDLVAGRVDVLIGTHRTLQEDVRFADLGLVVVDEEQRFGVRAKERLKELRTTVDVLTMSATPIPRTLEFGLTGIRDMSIVDTPPEDRLPVLTYVGEFDEQSVAAAVRRELLRDGQVFYVHNRVLSIDLVADEVRRLVPEARVAVAHGQMDDGTLEKIMLDFWEGEVDVLVATTIIESGLDIPRANTLIIDRADLLGLAQLYQLRGRVGRSRERAYAYLFYPPDRRLTEEAHERLKVIAEHQELGSGFAIAMRDLELRGAGNLLGGEQSGHIAAVGFDLYCQLVNEAVAILKGEEITEPEPVRLDLPVRAVIPPDYMPRESLRLEAYRRLGDATEEAAIADVRDEWLDRYGPPPEEVDNLLELARVKAAALHAGVREVVFSRGQARISPARPTGSRRMRLERAFPGFVVKEDREQVVVPYRARGRHARGAGARVELSGRDVCAWMTKVLEELAA